MIEKTCSNCGKEFQSQRKTALYCSRLCAHQAWVNRHKDEWREYNREWRDAHPDYWKEYYNDGRGKQVERRRHAKHPPERKARSSVYWAMVSGKIVRPETCQKCECREGIEAHHWMGYEKEHWLDVQWLCHDHHLEADRNME